MPSFFSRFNPTKSGKERSGAARTKPVTTRGGQSEAPASLLALELPSSSLLADTSRATPHFLSTPVRQLSFSSTRSSHGDGDHSDLRSLQSPDEASKWVSVDAEQTPRTIRTTPASGRVHQLRFPDLADPERERREQARLERARLTVEDVTLLSEECGDVIRSRGLTSLGLFRPYRASESPTQFRKLALLFLDYVAEFDARAAASKTTPSRGTDASKSVLLHAYRQELRFANVHDVVAVLKWGLRHIDFGRMTFSGSRIPSLEWYSSFVRRSSSASPPHPPHAFSQYLLPSLPPQSQKLLLSLLNTIQPVAAYAQQNAMPAHRLCYLLGAYLFGLATPPSPSSTSPADSNRIEWEEYARTWSESGRALEGCLKAYLREQTDLPPRLQELVEDYPSWISSADAKPDRGRTIKALKIEIESLGEWEAAGTARSYSQRTKSGRPARRRPVEVLAAANDAEPLIGQQHGDDDNDDESRAWDALSRMLRSADAGEKPSLAPLDEETVRVLELLKLDRGAATAAASIDTETVMTPSRRRDGSPHRRTRSSVDPADFSPARPMQAFLSPSPSMPTISPRAKLRSSPSWQDFSTRGFTQSSLDLSSDLYDPSKNRGLPEPRTRVVPPTSRISSISTVDVEEDFVAVWLDSLSESATTSSPAASWPSLLLSPLSPAAQSAIGGSSSRTVALLVVEALLPRQRPAAETLDSPPRISSPPARNPPAALDRRASFLGVRRARKSEGAPSSTTTTSPPSSPSKNWRRRASALFAPPAFSRHPSSDEIPSATSGGLGTVSLDSSPRARPRPSTQRAAPGPVPSSPPVDVFGTAIPVPASPPPLPPKEHTQHEENAMPPPVAEVEGYIANEPGLAPVQEPVGEPGLEPVQEPVGGPGLETVQEPVEEPIAEVSPELGAGVQEPCESLQDTPADEIQEEDGDNDNLTRERGQVSASDESAVPPDQECSLNSAAEPTLDPRDPFEYELAEPRTADEIVPNAKPVLYDPRRTDDAAADIAPVSTGQDPISASDDSVVHAAEQAIEEPRPAEQAIKEPRPAEKASLETQAENEHVDETGTALHNPLPTDELANGQAHVSSGPDPAIASHIHTMTAVDTATEEVVDEPHETHERRDVASGADEVMGELPSETRLRPPVDALPVTDELPGSRTSAATNSTCATDSDVDETAPPASKPPAQTEAPPAEIDVLAPLAGATPSEPPSTPSPRRRIPPAIVTPRRSFDSGAAYSSLGSPPIRSPRHPARGPSSPIRRSSTPGSRAALHKSSSSSLETEEIKQLRKVEEEAKRRTVKEPRTPKLVSNVKERVREIEEEVTGSPTAGTATAIFPATPDRSVTPLTPSRSSQRGASPPPSSVRSSPPTLAPAIVAGSPAVLARPIASASLLAGGAETAAETEGEVPTSTTTKDVLSSPSIDGRLSSASTSAGSEPAPMTQVDSDSDTGDHARTSVEVDDVTVGTTSPARLPPAPEAELEHPHVRVPTPPLASDADVVTEADKETPEEATGSSVAEDVLSGSASDDRLSSAIMNSMLGSATLAQPIFGSSTVDQVPSSAEVGAASFVKRLSPPGSPKQESDYVLVGVPTSALDINAESVSEADEQVFAPSATRDSLSSPTSDDGAIHVHMKTGSVPTPPAQPDLNSNIDGHALASKEAGVTSVNDMRSSRLPSTQELEHLGMPTGGAGVVTETGGELAGLAVAEGVLSSPAGDLGPSSASPEPETPAPPDFSSNIGDSTPASVEVDAVNAGAAPSRLPPTQESEHLHVTAPTPRADLPPPAPSPSPSVAHQASDSVPEDDTAQTEDQQPPVLGQESATRATDLFHPGEEGDSLEEAPDALTSNAVVQLESSSDPVDRPADRPATPQPDDSIRAEETTPLHSAPTTRPSAHVLHVSPSKQSLATTNASYRTAPSQATSLAGSDPESVA
ncbi:hypothetical protein JCM3774_006461 [Rhodotorula dairenensis]